MVVPLDHVGPSRRETRSRGATAHFCTCSCSRDALLPWTAEGALVALLTFALGIGVIAIVILLRLAAGRPRRRAPDRRTAGRADRLLQLDRGAVHDRGAPRDRARRPARAAGPASRAPDRVRVRGPAARGDRPEPGLAVHAAAGRDRGDRDRPGPPSGRGGRGAARSWARSSRCTAARRLPETPGRRSVTRRPAGRAALVICAVILRGHAARLGRSADRRRRPSAPAGGAGRSSARWRVAGGSPSAGSRPPTAIRSFIKRQWNGFSHVRRELGRLPLHRRRQWALRLLARRRSTRSWPTRSAGSGRTTSPTTTSRAGAPARSPRGRTASRCGCSRTPALVGFVAVRRRS